MNIYAFPPIAFLVTAAYWAVTAIASSTATVFGEASAACAVVLLTIMVRILLLPVGRSQVLAGLGRARIAPQIALLQHRYRQQPEALQRKIAELHKADGVSPFAGCLPVLAQAPVLIAVYGVFVHQEVNGEVNELLSRTLFGVPLGDGLVGSIASGSADAVTVVVHLVIMLLIAVVAQSSRKVLAPTNPANETSAGSPNLAGIGRALSFMPFATAVIAAFVPLAAALYLLTTSAWTLGERWMLTRHYRKRDNR